MLARLPKGREEIFKKTIDFACRDRCYIFFKNRSLPLSLDIAGSPTRQKTTNGPYFLHLKLHPVNTFL